MKLKFYIIILSCFLNSFACADTDKAANKDDSWLLAEQVIRDIDLAENAYQRIHPGYDRYASSSDLSNSWETIKANAISNNGMSIGDLYLEISKTLAMIRCDHTKAELPDALKKQRKTNPIYLPFRWQMIEGQAIVTAVETNSELRVGSRIVSIDGRSIEEMTNQLNQYIPVDGFTDHVKSSYMATSYEHMGGAFDHFGEFIWGAKAKVELDIIDQQGDNKQLSLNRIGHTAWLEFDERLKRSIDFRDSVTFRKIDETTAYLKIDSFVNYREPVEPNTIYQPIFSTLKKDKVDNLILDLRLNGGGSSDAKHGLFAHLIAKKTRLVDRKQIKTLNLDGLRQYLWTWEKRALNPKRMAFKKNKDGSYDLRRFLDAGLQYIKPAKTNFKGKLVVLTSKSNSSAVTSLLAKLKSVRDVTFIGEETGGSAEGSTAGILFYLTLPESKIKTRVPVFRYYNDVQAFEPGKGIKPDIEVIPSIVATLNKVDSAYERALVYLQE